jgi:phosphoglycerate dehydrogenase-like enzyme
LSATALESESLDMSRPEANLEGQEERIKIVVWDRVGNVMWGVRPWDEWSLRAQSFLLAEDPEGRGHAPSFAELFKEYNVHLRHVETVEELATEISDAEFLVVHKNDVPPEVLRRGEKLRLIQHLGWDHRGIPVQTAKEMSVPVAATPLTNYLAVAEHAWALILNLLKRLPAQRRVMEERSYFSEGWGMVPGVRLARGLTLGLLGFGEIARPMARMADAFGMTCLYWDIVPFPELEGMFRANYVEWEELFRQSDIVSVHLALNEQTEKIIGTHEFGLMKRDALFINTARGKLVDHAALVEVLRSHRIGGAGLDVFAEEPLPPDDPLLDLPYDPRYNVTLTPHTAWQGHWTHIRDSLEIWYNILRVLRDETIHHRVG